ncbi:MAG TPA: DUF3365 domain-containing protein [Chromatiales bacterium]|nr:DUF3365 domain-containing protein [Chromatiales bacterium]
MTLLPLALALATAPVLADEAAKIDQARAIAKEFGGTLKGELEKAMKAGGPVAAIEVCHSKAPAIAKDLSAKYRAEVHRTSLKPRATAPQDWEREVLADFDARRVSGEDPNAIEFHQVVEIDGKPHLRYMKAIGTMPVCLNCHGTDIKPEVKARLEALYPEDKATGYKAGELRGAFSITAPL